MIPASSIRPFAGHPYKVLDNEEMSALVNSINEQGIMSPLIVRPIEGRSDVYELISGHRRLHAAQLAGLTEVPVVVEAVSRDEAAIMLVDSNLHREHILPSEKAFAYKLKLEAMKRQGRRTDLTSDQFGPKLTAAEISDDDGPTQVKRYIRLTHLIPALLDMVDDGRIAFSVGVELSFLDSDLQAALMTAIDLNDCTPSYAQAVHMHKAVNDGSIDEDMLFEIMAEEKPNQKEKVSFNMAEMQRYFPNARTAADIRSAILRMLDRHMKDKGKEQRSDEAR
ncbi:MAG: ParB/RepB/Spo0J family partition protein [Clostridiales bacterium]|nr:ParB/RepB/Spo0J family partition protein [Clostridiales bacterium]